MPKNRPDTQTVKSPEKDSNGDHYNDLNDEIMISDSIGDKESYDSNGKNLKIDSKGDLKCDITSVLAPKIKA